ncbi:hypothetical protein Desdi_0224 [Desulfitobacterium dichloroeliminans LMG P-21439]|uniref:DUF4153 domain-containing protein n=1 Tax=Desulfitobacterium dichloroeliminans (strain LMG P-21439 / DCA1) TaxID=871963 RepID=L0F1N7_DESDL|nr:DUF4153 domain-containing protein [Desulfitobacterium dichloroeliminans]AGA67774.1 hypothetical protein Desdi_0224 [Desulfitobacterium dichloroeliminans LMG P-21439]
MSVFIQSTLQGFKGAIKAFQRFPASIASALGFAIVTMIRIQLDWPEQEPYNFLFNCLHWSFALGAVFSLAVITGAYTRYNHKKSFLTANLLGAAAVVVTFLVLYFFGGTYPSLEKSSFATISSLAEARVSVAILLSLIAFIYLAGYPKEQSDFARSFFMTLKAYFIALIYGLVIMAGTAGVAGAIEALLYEGMSEKVYMYLGTLSGFVAFTIFVGYFPDFRRGYMDSHREVAQKQPRFIQVLFEYILVPIVLALTIVLLLWAGRTILSGMEASFLRLYGIATAYTIGGILLHIIITHSESGLARFYRRVYPLAALVILAFEAWAFVIQLEKSGLKTTEYFFIVIWIIALISAILLLIRKHDAHPTIALLTCVMAVLAVFPLVGYQALPVSAQVNRLENLLIDQGVLDNNQLIPAVTPPELAVRESITDAVTYLAYAENAKLPAWFDKRLAESSTFKTKLGFEQTWPEFEGPNGNTHSLVTILQLTPQGIDIGDYRWALNLQDYEYQKEQSSATLNGAQGTYHINWTRDPKTNMPTLRIELNDRVILEQTMDDYIKRISASYPPNDGRPAQVGLQDMSLQFDTPEVTVLLVFNRIEMNLDPQADRIFYGFDLSSLYMKEK